MDGNLNPPENPHKYKHKGKKVGAYNCRDPCWIMRFVLVIIGILLCLGREKPQAGSQQATKPKPEPEPKLRPRP